MDLPERFEDLLSIQKLNDDFCYELDRGAPENFASLFTETALYTHGPRTSNGRFEILAFAKSRRATGPRTSRHVQSGLRIEFEAHARARGVSCCTTFAASANPPIASTLPVLVADFYDIYVIEGNIWRIAERNIVPIFTLA
jgi:SnoaL-like domain